MSLINMEKKIEFEFFHYIKINFFKPSYIIIIFNFKSFFSLPLSVNLI